MKKVLKKIGIILGIILGVLLFVGFVGFTYLVLVPNSSLLGITYITNKSAKYYQLGEYDVYTKPINQISIQTNKYSVKFVVDKDATNLQVYMKNDVAGFVKKSKSSTNIEYSYDFVNKILDIKTKEISGLVGYGISFIEVITPQNILTQNLVLKINVGGDAYVDVGGMSGTKIDTLSIYSWHGAINIDNIEMRALNICSSKSKIVVGENVGESIEHVKLDTGNSSVSFLKAGGGEKEIENAKKEKRTINKDDVKFNIVKMEITGMSKDGCLQLIKCDELCSTGYPIKRINGGSIECFYVASLIQFSTSNCDISVNEIGGSQNSIYDANGNGNFRLTNVVNGGITAYSDSGNISINQLLEVGDFKTNSGNITIKNASKSLQLISQSGNINVKFGDDVSEFLGDSNPYRRISLLRVKNSKVNISGLNVINAVVENGGKADIKLSYQKVLGENNFDIKSANLLAIVPKDCPLKINVDTINTMFNCHVGSATYPMSNLTGKYEKIVYTLLTIVDGSLNINANSGSVSLYSDDVYGA